MSKYYNLMSRIFDKVTTDTAIAYCARYTLTTPCAIIVFGKALNVCLKTYRGDRFVYLLQLLDRMP